MPKRPIVRGGKARSTLGPRLLQWLLIGVLVGLGSAHSIGLGSGLRTWLSVGLSFGLCSIFLQFLLRKNDTAEAHSQTSLPAEGTTWQRLIRRRAVYNGLLVGLLVGLSFWLSYGLSIWLNSGLSIWLSLGVSNGVIIGLLYGLSFGLSTGVLSSLLIRRSTAVQPIDLLVWSWRSLGKSLFSKSHASTTVRVTVLIGLGIVGTGVFYGLVLGLSNGLSTMLMGLGTALSIGLGIGLSYWLLFGLFQGVSSATIEAQRRVVPNQGIRRSALNGLVLGLISTVIVGLLGWLSTALSTMLIIGLTFGLSELSYGLSAGLILGLPVGLLAGLSAGLLVGLLKGGLASFRHYVLRFLLWRAGAVPWRDAQFLDYAAERILLRKVGGGYIFLHRLLLNYFANLETETGSTMSAKSRQEKLSPEMISSASTVPTGTDEHADVPTAPLVLTPALSEVSRLLPCGHEQRISIARFCSICGAPIQSSVDEELSCPLMRN